MFNLKSFLIVILLLAFAQSTYAADSGSYYANPKQIIDAINKRGAKQIVFELYQDQKIWDSVLRKIGSGEEAWLKVATALRSGSDAGASEMLTLAVSEALEHKPAVVFKNALQTFELRDICSSPDVDDERYNSYELSIRSVNIRIDKVASIGNPDLKDLSNKCIQYLEESKEHLARFYGVTSKKGML